MMRAHLFALAAILATNAAAQAAGITHIANSRPHSPIAGAVEVPPGATTLYVSGMGADIADPKAPKDTIAAYGNTETQTVSTLTRIRAFLEAHGYRLGDVIMMHAYLAGDPSLAGKDDVAGFMRGYLRFFGTAAQPDLPSRSAFQVAHLGGPGRLIEIEVIAARTR